LVERSDKQKLFEQILEENRKSLRRIARSSADGSNYQDLEQEILLALWKSLDVYEGRSNLKTWFYSVATKVVRKFARRNCYKRLESCMAIAEEPATYGNDHNLDPIKMLDDFVRSLDEMDRMVFLMRLDEVSYREIAETMNGNEAYMRVRANRIKKQFETLLNGR
jgi:RNA polymerase sigma factor (sigma-70 family)